MTVIVSENLAEIAKLCVRYGVTRLDVFGSAASGKFDPGRSDIDLLADFSATREPGYADRYLDFANALERLLGRHVDLITQRSIGSPLFAEAIRKQSVNIYESAEHQAA